MLKAEQGVGRLQVSASKAGHSLKTIHSRFRTGPYQPAPQRLSYFLPEPRRLLVGLSLGALFSCSSVATVKFRENARPVLPALLHFALSKKHL